VKAARQLIAVNAIARPPEFVSRQFSESRTRLRGMDANRLKPGVWYRLRWRISTDGMTVFVNDQVVFNETKANDVNIKPKISIAAVESVLDVRDFHVVTLTKP